MPRKKKILITNDNNYQEHISISARTEEQKQYMKAIVQNDIIVCSGRSGSGKTCVAAGMGVNFLKRGIFDKLILTRPQVASEDAGYLPGELEEKILPYLQPLYTELEQFINVKQAIAQNKIKILPIAYTRGVTFKNSYVICDEAQNLTLHQLRMILTRLGEGSKIILTGDTLQSDLDYKHNKDYHKFIQKLKPIAIPENKIAIIELVESVRHPLIEKIEQILM